MKSLYQRYLTLRVWFLRHRLRQMGFRDVPDQKTAETLVRLQMEPCDAQRLLLDFIKIGLIAAAVASMGLILGLRLAAPVQIVLPIPQKLRSSSAHPEATLPTLQNFEVPAIHGVAVNLYTTPFPS